MFNSTRFFIIILGLFYLSLAPSNCIASNKKVLFVQTAQSSIIYATNKQKTKYKITLENVTPYVMYFTDRPKRQSGLINISRFLTSWSKGRDSFSKDNPNAGLKAVMLDAVQGNKMSSYAMELSNPVYNHKQHTLTYDATPLKGSYKPPKTIRFGFTSIFIDDYYGFTDACLTCDHG